MPPLVTGLPSKPWVNRPHSPADLSPSTVPDLVTDSETESDTPVRATAASRKDGHTAKPADDDLHVQQTAQSYIKRPLPTPPTAPSSRSASPGIVKPWLSDVEHHQPMTLPRNLSSSPKYTLFPKNGLKVGLPASPARIVGLPASPAKQARLPSQSPPPPHHKPSPILLPATKFTPGLDSNLSGKPKPTQREHRGQTESQIPEPKSPWSPRSTSLNRSFTAPLESPQPSRPSTSAPPPTSRRPSAIDVIAAHEVGESTQLKAGPGHQYQVQHSPIPAAAVHAAQKWIQRKDRVKRKPAGRARTISNSDDSVIVSATLTSPVGMPDFPSELMIELVEDVDDLDSPTLPLTDMPMRFGQPEVETLEEGEVEEQDVEDTQRGRTLQRSFIGGPFTLGDLLSSPSPTFSPTFSQTFSPILSSTSWSLPPAKGPLQIRASAFKPFSPQLDSSLDIPDMPEMPEPLKILKEMHTHSISLALLPATTYVRDPSPVREPKKKQQKVPKEKKENEPPVPPKSAEIPMLRQHKKSVSDSSSTVKETRPEPVRAARSMSLALAKPLPPPPPPEADMPRRERGRLESKYSVNRSPSPLAVLASRVK